MGSAGGDKDFSHLQDVLGQILFVRTYSQIVLCFPVPKEDSFPSILRDLESGLSRLGRAFPWLAGQVVIEGKSESSTGLAGIVPLHDEISLLVQDHRETSSVPSYAELRQSRFPFRLLHRENFSPLPSIPETFDADKDAPLRVLEVRANLIRGGLLLNLAGNHHIMDMNGLGQVIALFSKACQNQAFTAAELKFGNCAKRDLIPLLGDSYQPGPEADAFLVKTKPVAQPPAPSDGEAPMAVNWAYFHFAAKSLASLKALAAEQTQVPYITTNDALTALLWQSIARARSSRDPQLQTSTAIRSIDARKYFQLPQEYPGHCVACTDHKMPTLLDCSISDIAGTLRHGLETSDVAYTVRAMATMLDRSSDKTSIAYAARMNPDSDVIFSSWAKTPSYTANFGPLLGSAECARRPRLAPIQSLVYFMPKDREGGIAVGMCLRNDDLDFMRHDDALMKFADYVG